MKIDGKVFQLTNMELKKLFKLNNVAYPENSTRLQLLDVYRVNVNKIKSLVLE